MDALGSIRGFINDSTHLINQGQRLIALTPDDTMRIVFWRNEIEEFIPSHLFAFREQNQSQKSVYNHGRRSESASITSEDEPFTI